MTETSQGQTDGNVSSPSSKRQKPQRRYGFACSNCRRRKARCDGNYPSCDKCAHNKEECNYDKGPSVTYAMSLQSRIKSHETFLEQLYRASNEERANLLDEVVTSGTFPTSQQKDSAAGTVKDTDSTITNRQVTLHEPAGGGEQPDEASVGVDGGICFYGKTSLYRVEPEDGGGTPLPEDRANNHEQSTTELDPATATGPYTSPLYLNSGLDLSVASVMSEIPTDTFNDLLTAYWSLPHHLHLVLVKRLFLRDLNIPGPYMTPFLLSSVLAQAARYCNRHDAIQVGNHFASRALQLLPQDIDRGSQIPTVQGLLIISSREVACGRTAQGWLYSGMAFRMMRDLGLHVPPRKLGHLTHQFSAEDLAVRQQVFWSCYTWDKTMSLCLGRAPIIHDTIEFPTPDRVLDGRAGDEEMWSPLTSQNDTLKTFSFQKALSSTRFTAYCELATIIDNVLDVLYSRPHSGRGVQLLDYLDSTLRTLDQWASKLSAELFIQRGSKTVTCPPLHILLLNLVYHATTILLCRPYRSNSQRARISCTEAARMIDLLFTLHVRRFGFKYITYLQTYTMFVASTINVLDFKENQRPQQDSTTPDVETSQRREADSSLAEEASARLDFGLEVLRQAGSTPSAARCAAIIARLLRKTNDQDDMTSTGGRRGSEQVPTDPRHTPYFGLLEHAASASPTKRSTTLRNSIGVDLGQAEAGPTMYNQNSPLSATHTGSHVSVPQNRSSHQDFSTPNVQTHNMQLPTSQFNQPQTLSSIHPRQSFDMMRSHTEMPIIETPLRWLPENMQDDGSWMLMMDGDPSYMFMTSQ